MALLIAPTPVLEGKDAERFLERVRLGLLKPAKLIPIPKLPTSRRRITMKVRQAAQNLFDNRLGWSNGEPPFAPRKFWYDLGCALYGKDDSRVQELAPKIPEKEVNHEKT